MARVGAFDVHRRQVTFDVLDTETGQVRRGLVRPACRATLRRFLAGYAGGGEGEFTVEGCTRWRVIVGGLERAGVTTHLGEPAATADARGSKRRGQNPPTRPPPPRRVAGAGRGS